MISTLKPNWDPAVSREMKKSNMYSVITQTNFLSCLRLGLSPFFKAMVLRAVGRAVVGRIVRRSPLTAARFSQACMPVFGSQCAMRTGRSGLAIPVRRFSIHAPVSVDFSSHTNDTIFQLSSGGGGGRAGVAVIRISGPCALEALQLVRTNPHPKPGSKPSPPPPPAPRVATLCKLYEPAVPSSSDSTATSSSKPMRGAVLDSSVLALYFPAPHSFTGEAVVELHVHGNAVVVRGVLAALSRLKGCRLAVAGEFTRRAFTYGKLDLTQVEALSDLLNGAFSNMMQTPPRLLPLLSLSPFLCCVPDSWLRMQS
jgi:hypothetical protein